ncbi:MAG: hypothetical protein JEY99_04965 [Spirochaetales bacterium]|nr:hypothetical protein [Spirochaetales bacterium]
MDNSKKLKVIIIIVAVTILIVLLLIIPPALAKQRRLKEIYIDLSDLDPVDSLFFTELDLFLENNSIDLINEAESNLYILNGTEISTLENSDLSIKRANLNSDRSNFIAFNSYVLIADTRWGQSPTKNRGASISQLNDWLVNLNPSISPSVIVAGDEEEDFAAFILYLAGELLEDSSFHQLIDYLHEGNSNNENDSNWLVQLEPVLNQINNWRNKGILAANWTNWDFIALENTMETGKAPLTFELRSRYKAMDWNSRFHLESHPLPMGAGQNQSILSGQAIVLEEGFGVRADIHSSFTKKLQNSAFQETIEEGTNWSPVSIPAKLLNREHRDIVRLYESATFFNLITTELAMHPLFERMHIALR